jgi:hypothetical protein
VAASQPSLRRCPIWHPLKLHKSVRLYAQAAGAGISGRCPLFSNRPFELKHFQTIRQCNVDVAHGLALLFGIGTRALPSWDSRTK